MKLCEVLNVLGGVVIEEGAVDVEGFEAREMLEGGKALGGAFQNWDVENQVLKT